MLYTFELERTKGTRIWLISPNQLDNLYVNLNGYIYIYIYIRIFWIYSIIQHFALSVCWLSEWRQSVASSLRIFELISKVCMYLNLDLCYLHQVYIYGQTLDLLWWLMVTRKDSIGSSNIKMFFVSSQKKNLDIEIFTT